MSSQPATKRLPHAQRHVQLLDVAESLFIDRGYAAVSMEDIARSAGVSRPIVYNHLKGKEQAYLACVERARATYQSELLERVGLAASPREQLRAGAEGFFAMLERHPGRWQLLFGSNAVLPGTFTQELAALRFQTIEQIRQLLQAAAPDAPPQRIEACAHAVSGVGERLGHWWLTRPEMPREELIGHYVEILWAGLSPYLPPESR